MSQGLNQPRTVEKQKLEEAYWKELGIPFSIIAERELNVTRIANLELLYGYRSYEQDDSLLENWLSLLLKSLDRQLSELTDLLDVQHSLLRGTPLNRFALVAYRFDTEHGTIKSRIHERQALRYSISCYQHGAP